MWKVGPPGISETASEVWSLHIADVFGVQIFAPRVEWRDDGSDYVAWTEKEYQAVPNVLAELLDNDQDGCPDDPDLTKILREKKFTIFLPCVKCEDDLNAQRAKRSMPPGKVASYSDLTGKETFFGSEPNMRRTCIMTCTDNKSSYSSIAYYCST
jgi:hypothetical protein